MWLRQALKVSFDGIRTVDSRSTRVASHLGAHVRSEVSALLKRKSSFNTVTECLVVEECEVTFYQ